MSELHWPLATAAAECGVSKSTIKRRLTRGDLPNATKDAHGRWQVPLTDLIAAGLRPGRPSPPDDLTQAADLDHGSTDLGHDLGQARPNRAIERVHELERDLAQERERARSLDQANADLRAHIEDMRMALRMLEPGPSSRALSTTEEPSLTPQASNEDIPASRSLLRRLFQRR